MGRQPTQLEPHDKEPSVPGGAIKVLLVEDDERLARFTREFLEKQGMLVTLAGTGPAALSEAAARQFDVVLLDLQLPGKDGLSVCRVLRQKSSVPIIMLTARSAEDDRVAGLDAGADDYVSKPFSVRELASRIYAIVRRVRGQAGPRRNVIQVGELVVDPERLRVTLGGKEVTVTSYEFDLLRVLAEHHGEPLSREQLLDLAKLGGAEEAFDRSIDVRISKLRAKLGDDSRKPRLLKTVRGVGYVLTMTGGGDDSEAEDA